MYDNYASGDNSFKTVGGFELNYDEIYLKNRLSNSNILGYREYEC